MSDDSSLSPLSSHPVVERPLRTGGRRSGPRATSPWWPLSGPVPHLATKCSSELLGCGRCHSDPMTSHFQQMGVRV